LELTEQQQSWLSEVAAQTGGTVNGTQGDGHCPVCDKRTFRFTIGRKGRLTFSCQSGTCRERSLENYDPSWFSFVRTRLLQRVPSDAFRPTSEESTAQCLRRPPTVDDLDHWTNELLVRMSSGLDVFGLTAERAAACDLGWSWDWDRGKGRLVCPVFDPLADYDDLQTVVYRSLDGIEPKSRVHAGTQDRHLYAPLGLNADKPVLLAGGEKDVLRAIAEGFDRDFNVACFTGGDGPPADPARADPLCGLSVLLAGDIDAAAKSQRLATFLLNTANEVRIADLSQHADQLPPNGDVYDLLEHKELGSKALCRLLADALPWDGREGDAVLRDIRSLFLADNDDATDHMSDVYDDEGVHAQPDPDYVIDGWVPRGLYSVLYGAPGVKKTFALLGMSRAVRRGTRWQNHKTCKGATLFYQGEGLAQLKPRIRAWDDRYELRIDQSMSPGGYLERFVDVTKPEGVAAIVRTVRKYEQRHGCTVQMVVLDPLVEFMTGDENGDGMNNATRGLRALASYLNIAVIVGHHTNASGDRARGADFHRMRAGAFMQMEELPNDEVGIWQEKQKNSEALAVILEAVEHAESLVLEWRDNLPVRSYVMVKESGKKKQQETAKADGQADKRRRAAALLVEACRESPGLSRRKLINACAGKGFGKDFLDQALDALVDPRALNRIRVEEGGARGAQLHFINDAE
jgi:hypothetical protein